MSVFLLFGAIDVPNILPSDSASGKQESSKVQYYTHGLTTVIIVFKCHKIYLDVESILFHIRMSGGSTTSIPILLITKHHFRQFVIL